VTISHVGRLTGGEYICRWREGWRDSPSYLWATNVTRSQGPGRSAQRLARLFRYLSAPSFIFASFIPKVLCLFVTSNDRSKFFSNSYFTVRI
jgi:hypothetical protein